jgi:hypothetical protein
MPDPDTFPCRNKANFSHDSSGAQKSNSLFQKNKAKIEKNASAVASYQASLAKTASISGMETTFAAGRA